MTGSIAETMLFIRKLYGKTPFIRIRPFVYSGHIVWTKNNPQKNTGKRQQSCAINYCIWSSLIGRVFNYPPSSAAAKNSKNAAAVVARKDA